MSVLAEAASVPMGCSRREIVDVFLVSGTGCWWHSQVSKGRCACDTGGHLSLGDWQAALGLLLRMHGQDPGEEAKVRGTFSLQPF